MKGAMAIHARDHHSTRELAQNVIALNTQRPVNYHDRDSNRNHPRQRRWERWRQVRHEGNNNDGGKCDKDDKISVS